MLVQHHIQNEINTTDPTGLLNVLPYRVGVQVAGASFRTNHHGVVGLNGIPGGNAGHNGFDTAGITGKVVKFDVAQANTVIRFCHRPGDVHGRAGIGGAQMDTILGIGIDAADFLAGTAACQLFYLLGGVVPVRT